MDKPQRVAKTSDIPPGAARSVLLDDQELLICNVAGRFYAIENLCTHDGGPLDQGELSGTVVECPRHGATFDVTSGAALSLPAVLPLKTYRVDIDGDDIYASESAP